MQKTISLALSFLAKIITTLNQLSLGVIIFKIFGAGPVGIFGVIQGTSSIALMTTFMAMPRLAAIRYGNYSYQFYSSAAFIASFFAFIFSIFWLAIFDWRLLSSFFVFVFTIKAIDAISEINGIFYRRKKIEGRYLKIQVLKLLIIILSSTFVYLAELSIELLFLLILTFSLVILINEMTHLGFKYNLLTYAPSIYKKLFSRAHANSLGAFISTVITNSPRYAAMHFIGENAAGIYLMASYVYIGITTVWSMIIQLIITGCKDITNSWISLQKKLFKAIFIFYPTTFAIIIIADKFIQKISNPLNSKNVFYLIIWLVLSSAFLVVKDFYGYIFTKKGKISLINAANFIGLLIFWGVVCFFNYNLDLPKLGASFFAGCFLTALMIFYLFARKIPPRY